MQPDELLGVHRHGKIALCSRVSLKTRRELSLVYTPGVAEPCRLIRERKELAYEYTAKGNLVAVVSDGSAVLGLGDVGPEAALPVMEAKAVLFKKLAGVDAFPICLATRDPDRIVEAVKVLEPTFGGINLEDIAAPACFRIEERLKRELSIPVFHDDQHGTAVVVVAGLLNALRLVGKQPPALRVVVNGAGAAGLAVARLLLRLGVRDLIVCDRRGVLHAERREGMNPYKLAVAALTNPRGLRGGLGEALADADVFIGLSGPDVITAADVARMAPRAIVFALANPDPEIHPAEALAGGAAVVATGRSDYPNQINNVLAFPGIFRGVLDVRAREINDEMKLAAARAIAGVVKPEALRPDHIVPEPLDPEVVPAVAAAVAGAAWATGVARMYVDPATVARRVRELTAA